MVRGICVCNYLCCSNPVKKNASRRSSCISPRIPEQLALEFVIWNLFDIIYVLVPLWQKSLVSVYPDWVYSHEI